MRSDNIKPFKERNLKMGGALIAHPMGKVAGGRGQPAGREGNRERPYSIRGREDKRMSKDKTDECHCAGSKKNESQEDFVFA